MKIDDPLTLNEILAIIEAVCRCGGIDDDVVAIAEPMVTVIDGAKYDNAAAVDTIH
ncbi:MULTISPECIES: hypothetical protein [Klebsiella pneumoniae complex]|uniref:hypothetical protein n=1 Tax=Klebsiella pneumoniae complex TaxID=3390273 RepID=UPI001D0DD5A4|nr:MULTISPECIES: hypothetical protein [Klebsiella]